MFRSKLYWRIVSNFGLLLFIMFALTLLTFKVLGQMQQHFEVASKDVRSLTYFEQLRIYLTDVPDRADEYLFTGSLQAQAMYEAGWKDFDVQISLLKNLLPDSSAQRDLNQIRQLFYGWIEGIGDKKMLLRNANLKAGELDKELRRFAQMEANIQYIPTARDILRARYRNAIGTQLSRLESAFSLSTDLGRFVVLVNLLLAVFAIALGFVLTRSITKPVRVLRSGTKNIMEGNFEPINVHRSDEFGELANDFNQMSSMLSNTYGRLQAYSELVTALNTHDSLKDVESHSLQLLCQHSGSAVGALYLADENLQSLERVAGFGLSMSEPVQRFRLGEGIPGECARLGRQIEVQDIAAASTFIIDTGLVRIVPAYVLATPIVFQEKTIGVIVLGAPQPFDEMRKEIINNSVPQIGVAITNARNYEATQKLSIEIAHKHEELNIKNTELQKAYRVKSDFLAGMSHELR
ncbi:MAG: GAF domain-containing protein, partial [Ignavibacteriales bacterium]|nr:GAF domain-containing protein [Ignavibacteriales bacterium]